MIRIRVATFIIRNGLVLDGLNSWWLRRRTTARTIASLGADVIALQEVHRFQQRYLERRLRHLRFVGIGRAANGGGERCPVLVSRRVAVVDSRTWWFGPSPDRPGTRLPGANFPRIATRASLAVPVPGGDATRPVEVVSTHLDEASAENRRLSAVQLAAECDPNVPTIVMGDLNADPDSQVIRVLTASGLRLVEPAGPAGTEHRFTGRTDGRRIDHILVSEHFEVVSAGVVTRRYGRFLPSDHWPVVAELRLTEE